ncbi:104aa long hypothetical protein [Pyrococcus horikoshii OT3]|uniref:Uncharacterized protein n=1 Tax=Pyrococcus horikoshii (strain ATCC 700860 / DSM 12428 / JCM 9974 / NBRC 100139 / OT-3) TaxID=70601 RepID=O59528_PYRHO|nr:104aa long hypothetical protein [Pyrococcus horikoshii OT3]
MEPSFFVYSLTGYFFRTLPIMFTSLGSIPGYKSEIFIKLVSSLSIRSIPNLSASNAAAPCSLRCGSSSMILLISSSIFSLLIPVFSSMISMIFSFVSTTISITF